MGDLPLFLKGYRCPDCARLESFKDAENLDAENTGLSATNITWDQLGASIIWLSAFIGAYFLYKATDTFSYKELIFSAGTLIIAFIVSQIAARLVGMLGKAIFYISLAAFLVFIVAMLIKYFFV